LALDLLVGGLFAREVPPLNRAKPARGDLIEIALEFGVRRR
jgi:hypothetical protein